MCCMWMQMSRKEKEKRKKKNLTYVGAFAKARRPIRHGFANRGDDEMTSADAMDAVHPHVVG